MADSKTTTPMTPKDARRIQSHSDRTDTNREFKVRTQRITASRGGADNSPGKDKSGGKGK